MREARKLDVHVSYGQVGVDADDVICINEENTILHIQLPRNEEFYASMFPIVDSIERQYYRIIELGMFTQCELAKVKFVTIQNRARTIERVQSAICRHGPAHRVAILTADYDAPFDIISGYLEKLDDSVEFMLEIESKFAPPDLKEMRMYQLQEVARVNKLIRSSHSRINELEDALKEVESLRALLMGSLNYEFVEYGRLTVVSTRVTAEAESLRQVWRSAGQVTSDDLDVSKGPVSKRHRMDDAIRGVTSGIRERSLNIDPQVINRFGLLSQIRPNLAPRIFRDEMEYVIPTLYGRVKDGKETHHCPVNEGRVDKQDYRIPRKDSSSSSTDDVRESFVADPTSIFRRDGGIGVSTMESRSAGMSQWDVEPPLPNKSSVDKDGFRIETDFETASRFVTAWDDDARSIFNVSHYNQHPMRQVKLEEMREYIDERNYLITLKKNMLKGWSDTDIERFVTGASASAEIALADLIEASERAHRAYKHFEVAINSHAIAQDQLTVAQVAFQVRGSRQLFFPVNEEVAGNINEFAEHQGQILTLYLQGAHAEALYIEENDRLLCMINSSVRQPFVRETDRILANKKIEEKVQEVALMRKQSETIMGDIEEFQAESTARARNPHHVMPSIRDKVRLLRNNPLSCVTNLDDTMRDLRAADGPGWFRRERATPLTTKSWTAWGMSFEKMYDNWPTGRERYVPLEVREVVGEVLGEMGGRFPRELLQIIFQARENNYVGFHHRLFRNFQPHELHMFMSRLIPPYIDVVLLSDVARRVHTPSLEFDNNTVFGFEEDDYKDTDRQGSDYDADKLWDMPELTEIDDGNDRDEDDDVPPPRTERGNYVYHNNNTQSSFATSGIPGRLSAILGIDSLVSNDVTHTSVRSDGRVLSSSNQEGIRAPFLTVKNVTREGPFTLDETESSAPAKRRALPIIQEHRSSTIQYDSNSSSSSALILIEQNILLSTQIPTECPPATWDSGATTPAVGSEAILATESIFRLKAPVVIRGATGSVEVQIGGNPHNQREALSGPTLVIPELGPEMHIASMSLMVQPDKNGSESFFVLCARKGYHFGLESEVAQEKMYNFLKDMRPFTLGNADMVNGLWKESSKPAEKAAMDEEF